MEERRDLFVTSVRKISSLFGLSLLLSALSPLSNEPFTFFGMEKLLSLWRTQETSRKRTKVKFDMVRRNV